MVGVNTLRLAAPGCCSDSRIPVLVACGTWPPRRLSLLSLSVHFGRLWSLQLAWQLRTIRGAIAAAPIPHALLRQFQESRRQRKLLLLMRWPSFLKTCVAASCLDKKKTTNITFNVELVTRYCSDLQYRLFCACAAECLCVQILTCRHSIDTS